MQSIGRGNPGFVKILCIAVGGDKLLPRVKGIVHTGNVVGFKQIIRVKNKIALKAFPAVVLLYSFKKELKGKALCPVLVVEPLIAYGSVFAGNLGGFVGTVIRHDKYGYKLLRIVLLCNTVKQIADNLFLVSCRDYNGVFVLFFRRLEFSCKEKPDYTVNRLISEHNRKHRADCGVYNLKHRIPAAHGRKNACKVRRYIKKHFKSPLKTMRRDRRPRLSVIIEI